MKLRRLTRTGWFQRAAGFVAAEYLRFVWLTNRFQLDPPDLYDRVDPTQPFIVAFWHGQHFMMPFLKRKQHRAKVLVSRHADGEINAIAAERLHVGTVRGSGATNSEFLRKGGLVAFRAMLKELADGCNMALTADVPKVSRIAGTGVVMLARESGRPIFPVAIATSRFVQLENWDRSAINLPFGRGVIALGETIIVPPDADDAELERLRQRLEDQLNEVTRRAYTVVGRADVVGPGSGRSRPLVAAREAELTGLLGERNGR